MQFEIELMTLQNQTCKLISASGKDFYIIKLNDIKFIKESKMKRKNVTPNAYIQFIPGVNKEKPRFSVGDQVRISNTKVFRKKLLY